MSEVVAFEQTSRRMAGIRRQGTDIELALRKELFRRGFRYRVDFKVLMKPRRLADVVFPRLRVAVFVDGCFWHGCPMHATWPKRNSEFWKRKIEENSRRDLDTEFRLVADGWTVLRVWGHESSVEAADRIAEAILAATEKIS